MGSQLTASTPAPTFVAELTESHSLIADIPPLEHVVYSKEIQTSDMFETPQISEEEIRQQVMEELEIKERQLQAQLEEERKRAEQEKAKEHQGKKDKKKSGGACA